MDKYNVYMVDNLHYGDGRVDRNERFCGVTCATTEKKAISNIRFRLGLKPADLYCEWAGDGYRETTFRAEKIN